MLVCSGINRKTMHTYIHNYIHTHTKINNKHMPTSRFADCSPFASSEQLVVIPIFTLKPSIANGVTLMISSVSATADGDGGQAPSSFTRPICSRVRASSMTVRAPATTDEDADAALS